VKKIAPIYWKVNTKKDLVNIGQIGDSKLTQILEKCHFKSASVILTMGDGIKLINAKFP